MTDLMPTIFFGHGNPMNAYTKGWTSIGQAIPLSAAATWCTNPL